MTYPKMQSYDIMPRYWPLRKLACGILFGGLTAAVCYYFYRQAQKNINQGIIHLNTRESLVQKMITESITHHNNSNEYRFILYNRLSNTNYDNGLKATIESALNSIDTPISQATTHTLHQGTLEQTYTDIKAIDTLWNDYSSRFGAYFVAGCKGFPPLIYGLGIADIQAAALRNGPTHHNYDFYFYERWFFEPLSPLEDLFDLSKRRCTILIDKSEQ